MTKEEFITYIFDKINVSYVINKPRSKSKVLSKDKYHRNIKVNKRVSHEEYYIVPDNHIVIQL